MTSNHPPDPATTADPDARNTSGRRRPVLADLGDAIWSVLTTAAGLGLGISLVEGVSADAPLALLVLAGFIVFFGDLMVAPVLRRVASLGSVVAALASGVLGQLAVIVLALIVAPGIRFTSWTALLMVITIAALVMSCGRWLLGTADSSYVVGNTIRRGRALSRRRARRAERGTATPPPKAEAGLLVVQLDGVSPQVLHRAIMAGLAPNLARWLREGTHVMEPWWVSVPCTTPASMAGLLHGDHQQIAAFRWWDRDLGRMVVTNRPTDADLVEGRMEPGRGLLRDGGVAVSTMFSGEAETSLLVMSRALRLGAGLGPGGSYLPFFAQPFLLPRAMVLSVAEMIKELYQGRRQRLRGVLPRVRRRGGYVILRGITNVLLRDLNLSLVAEQMTHGAPIIFVDLVDYDEIAHHAGPDRPESMRALEGLDQVLHQFELVARAVPTDYRIVIVSDHGQSLGTTFQQLTGTTLADRVAALMDDDAVDVVRADSGEEYGPVNALISSVLGRAAKGADGVLVGPERERRRGGRRSGTSGSRSGSVSGEESDGESGSGSGPVPGKHKVPELAVIGSGNLGMVWFPQLDHRPDIVELEQRWPGMIPGLTLTAGIGLVMVSEPGGGTVVIGRAGAHHLHDGTLEGEDPLLPYGPMASRDLLRLSALRHCGDIVMISAVDGLGLVHAFEGLVGSHGGLGGEQNSGLLMHPAAWPVDEDLLTVVDGDVIGPEGGALPPPTPDPAAHSDSEPEVFQNNRLMVGSWTVYEQLLRWRRAAGAGPAPSGEDDRDTA